MDFKPVSLEDRDILNSYLLENEYGSCDLSFTNLYIWRRVYKVSYCIEDGFLVLKSLKDRFIMPLGNGDLKVILEKIIDFSYKNGHTFNMVGITPGMKEKLEKAMLGRFVYKCTHDLADYIYNSKDLIELKGKSFHSKRNHINRFIANNQFEYVTIDENVLPEVLSMAEDWYLQDGVVMNETLEQERYAVRDALNNLDALGLKGGAIRTKQGIVAFSLGQPLNNDIFGVNIEKARYDVAGAYAIINQQFTAHECKNYRFVNREEDLGIEGLRKSKMSYNPVIILDKCAATLKKT